MVGSVGCVCRHPPMGGHALGGVSIASSQLFRTVGMEVQRFIAGNVAPFMAPQSVCPQTTAWLTFSASTAYSITADTPPSISAVGRHHVAHVARATKMFRRRLLEVNASGSMRESAQVISSVCGVCGWVAAYSDSSSWREGYTVVFEICRMPLLQLV